MGVQEQEHHAGHSAHPRSLLLEIIPWFVEILMLGGVTADPDRTHRAGFWQSYINPTYHAPRLCPVACATHLPHLWSM